MELIINNATYILKPVNIERRDEFVQLVLKNYNLECADFDVFIDEVQKVLLSEYKLNLTRERVKINFFKEHQSNVIKSLWSFIQDQDKRILQSASNLNVDAQELIKFIEYVSFKIKEYCSYVGKIKDSKQEDIYSVYSFIAKTYGWSFPEIIEMDNLQLYKAIENAISMSKDQELSEINQQALAGALAAGSKQAKSQIDKMHNRRKIDKFEAELKKTNPDLKMKNELSRDELKKMMDSNG